MGQEQQFERPYEDDWDAPQPRRPDRAAPAAPKPVPAPSAPAAGQHLPQGTAAQTALAAWPARDRVGLYPALFSRSALFQVGRGARVKTAAPPRPRQVACQGEHELSATGPRLSMRDKAAWEFALDRARGAGLIGAQFELPLRSCALALGATKDRSAATLRRVRESLERLAATTLDYKLSTGEKGSFRLLATAQMRGKVFVAALDPKLGALLEADFLFQSEGKRRRGLGSDMAKWLHDFHSTHEQFDGAFALDTLRGLCGFEAQEGHFPSQLKAALQAVKEAAPGVLADFQIAKPAAKSGKWKASVTRGEEVVPFEMPEREWRKRRGRPNL